jgi:hypothetical protein
MPRGGNHSDPLAFKSLRSFVRLQAGQQAQTVNTTPS